MIVKTTEIKWDTDGDEEVAASLPQQVEIEVEDEDRIADALSDKYGWCVFSVQIEGD